MTLVAWYQDDRPVVAFRRDGLGRDFTLFVDSHALNYSKVGVVRNELIEIKQGTMFPKEAMRVVERKADIVVGISHDLPSGIDGHGFGTEVPWHDTEIYDLAFVPEYWVKVSTFGPRRAYYVAMLIDGLGFGAPAKRR